MMVERVAKVRIKKEIGYLYYVKSDEEGWLCIYRTIAGKKSTMKK